MKRYTASRARERFADVLDEAERTGSVVIQRGSSEYVITPRRKTRSVPRRSIIKVVDPAVESGQWTWDLTSDGLEFTPRRPRRS